MAYTFIQKSSSVVSNFGGLSNDANRSAMQVAGGIQTQDATGSPVTSPIAFPTTQTTLTVPLNAIYLCLYPLTNTLNVGEVSNSVTTYVTCPVGVLTRIPCARMGSIFIKANTGAATGSTFYFEVV